ncbi:MAG: endonuclease/exonuclease/phosphatase family protein [Clostridia bacterium]|nr:endonuclease/exonuclease/phosphatase family protein [Clostridia bacterium]
MKKRIISVCSLLLVLALLSGAFAAVSALIDTSVYAAESAPTGKSEPLSLRVGTFNIQAGAGVGYNFKILAKQITNAKLDIVGLQEVDKLTGRNRKQDTMKALAEATGYEYYGYSKCITLDGGEYGHGILSRYPITSYDTVLLPGGGEQRAYGHAVIEADGITFDFINTHLTWPEKSARAKQFPLLEKLMASKQTAIFVGDINTEDTEEYMPYFPNCNFANGADTYYVTNPEVGGGAIDNIITTSNTITQIATGCENKRAYSDHYMLWADLQIKRDTGFKKEDGGIRYYDEGVALTGWQVILGNVHYFDPQTGLMVTDKVSVEGETVSLEKFSFKGFTLYRLSPKAEPFKNHIPQQWLKWLLEVDRAAEKSTYKNLTKGAFYRVSYTADDQEHDPSAFAVTAKNFLLSYQFSDTELKASENYTFEIWYKDADVKEDYKRVTTKAYKVYELQGNSNVLYRLPVYEAGMTDLTTNKGKTNTYDMVIVVYEGETIVGYKQIAVDYTDSAELFLGDVK